MSRFETPFADRLFRRVRAIDSRLVVGIDPFIERFPEELDRTDPESALIAYGIAVLDAVTPFACAVKPQIAFFEQHGWRGWRALEAVCAAAVERGLPVILDAKRGDIGSTAGAYARGLLGDAPGGLGASVDALTVNPYLGSDSLEPFIARVTEGGRGLFVLARTSNPGGGEFQSHGPEGRPLYLEVARRSESWQGAAIGECGYGSVGLVAGATFPEELARIRETAPRAPLLVPGIGAQGGDPRDIAAAFDDEGLGAVVNSSRGVILAFEKDRERPWQEAVQEAARRTRDAIATACTPARPGA
ncbi:MAG: orotidine-5'-phosphate decarboxylase [Planctomycetota bacterium]|jgi:orotidine-5'-phosphate decarboxylase